MVCDGRVSRWSKEWVVDSVSVSSVSACFVASVAVIGAAERGPGEWEICDFVNRGRSVNAGGLSNVGRGLFMLVISRINLNVSRTVPLFIGSLSFCLKAIRCLAV